MGYRKIEGFEYQCDRCSKTHYQENAKATYHNSVPPGWLRVNIHPGEGQSVETSICRECADVAIYNEMPYLRPVMVQEAQHERT